MKSYSIAKSRRVRSSPYTSRIEKQGVTAYTVYNHMLLPAAFGSIEDSCSHLKKDVQVWDVAAERQVEIKGKDLGIGAFIIPTSTKGLEIGGKEKKMGWRSSDTRQIFFNKMRIPKDSMMGKPGEGFKKFLKTLVSGRISIGALSLGTAIGAYEKALNYSCERKSFGKTINKFQSIAFKLADMATKIESSKHLVYNAAWLQDQGLDVTKEAAMAKLQSSEAAMDIATEAIQIMGANGYVREGKVERYFRDAKILEIGEGTSEIQRIIISRKLIENYKS